MDVDLLLSAEVDYFAAYDQHGDDFAEKIDAALRYIALHFPKLLLSTTVPFAARL